MSDFENAKSPASVSPRPPRTWDFMETTFVSLLAYGAFILASEFFFNVILGIYGGAKTLSPAQLQTLAMQERVQSTALIMASPLAIAVLWIAIRTAGREFAEYLALNWPTANELGRALAIMTIVLVIETLIISIAGEQNPPAGPFLRSEGVGGLFIFLVSTCIVAPAMEEFLARGFMFRGWSQSFLGPIGAIVLTSIVWAMLHTQYDWLGRFCLFVSGIFLGHFRWRSNSTWLAVMAHSAMNMFALFIWILLYA